MLHEISHEIKRMIQQYTENDSIIFNNKMYAISQQNFHNILVASKELVANPPITFIDGGQAEIISSGNFCLSFIRIIGITFEGNKKKKFLKHDFYLFTRAVYERQELYYKSTIYSSDTPLCNEQDLTISSVDPSIKIGLERAPIAKVSSMARRFAELGLAASITHGFILLDGTLERTFPREEKYLANVPKTTAALAKSSSLFTTSGNSSVVLLQKIGPKGTWKYTLPIMLEQTSFVKLHPKARHIFRFEGNTEILPPLIPHCESALFLGYPYGLILADKLARVSNEEKKALATKFLLRKENKEILDYLATSDAHSILDTLG